MSLPVAGKFICDAMEYRQNKFYLDTKSMLRQYYANQGQQKKSFQILNWNKYQILRKAYALGLIEGNQDGRND